MLTFGARLTVKSYNRSHSVYKHCETSCKRDVTLCNALKMRCSVAAIVAKSRTWFYFVQWLLQQKYCETCWLRGMIHLAISRATCVATKLYRDKLHRVTAPWQSIEWFFSVLVLCTQVKLMFDVTLSVYPHRAILKNMTFGILRCWCNVLSWQSIVRASIPKVVGSIPTSDIHSEY